MSVAATTAQSPGWYPDPEGHDRLLWFNGSGWTDHPTEPPQAGAEVPFVADILPEDFDLPDDDPIVFSWEDTIDGFDFTLEDFTPGPEAEPELSTTGPFTFRASAQDPVRVRVEPEHLRELFVYESPQARIPSPLRQRIQVRAPVEAPDSEPEPDPEAHVEAPPAPPTRRRPLPRLALTGTAGLIVAAAAAAQITNLLSGDDAPDRPAAPATAPISIADRTCLKEWNTTTSATAAQLRVTVGQFTGSYARVGRVAPLPGTLMAPDSCALTVYDPATDTNAVFVAGVQDQLGYMDVTSYPRAKTYGWPKSEREANVAIGEDGSISAL